MRLIFTLILFSITPTLVAQSFSKTLINQADSLYRASSYELASKTYASAFKLGDASSLQYYNAACSYALTANIDSAFYWLETAADYGWTNTDHLRRDADLASLRSDQRWEEVIQKMEVRLQKFNERYNVEAKNALETLFLNDQVLRQLYVEAEQKFGKNTTEMKHFWSIIEKQDHLNQKSLDSLLAKYGWLGTNEVGGKANMAQFLVIQHADIRIQEKALPMLRKSVSMGQSNPKHLATLEDRILVKNEGIQKYGTQFLWNDRTQRNELFPLQNYVKIDSIRGTVGLDSLHAYLKKMRLFLNQ